MVGCLLMMVKFEDVVVDPIGLLHILLIVDDAVLQFWRFFVMSICYSCVGRFCRFCHGDG